jgi:hypothetical protein
MLMDGTTAVSGSPVIFFPVALLRRNRPLLFFSRNFARNPYGIVVWSLFWSRFSILPCILPLLSRLLKQKGNRRDAIENIIDADPVGAHVRELMADRAQWTGSASDLLQAGINVGGNATVAWIRSGWPKSPRALAGRLRRAQTPLRALGIEIAFGREGRLGTRTIRITAMGENRTHNTVTTVSRISAHGDRAGPNHPPGLEQAL